MNKGLLGIGSVIGIGILCVGCSNNNPVQVSEGNSPLTVATISSALEVTPPVLRAAPGMVESTMYPGNFEIVRRVNTTTPTSLQHFYWTTGMSQWSAQATFGNKIASDPAICATHNIAGNPATPYELHVLVTEIQGSTSYLVHWKRVIVGPNQYQWVSMGNCQLTNGTYITGVTGTPAMVCNKSNNNFEVLVRTAASGMTHFVLTPSSPYWRLEKTSLGMNSDAGICQASNGYLYASAIEGSSGNSGKLVCWENRGYGWSKKGELTGTDVAGYKIKTGIAPRTDGRFEIFYARTSGPSINYVTAVQFNPSNNVMALDGWINVDYNPTQITVATLGSTIHMHCYTSSADSRPNRQYRIYQ